MCVRPADTALAPGACFAALVMLAAPAFSSPIDVPAGSDLAAVIEAAAPGELLRLAAGRYDGPVKVDRPLAIEGEPGALIDGHGEGRTVEVVSPGVTIRGLTLRGSGMSLERMDAAIFLEQSAANAVVEGNVIEDNLVGVYIHGAPDVTVRRNKIAGRILPHLNDSGNGVYLWNAPGVQVLDNDISGGRDGIFTNASRNDIFRGNRIHGVRFAVHYMYTNDSEVSGNLSIGNHAGFVIMFSSNVKTKDNASRDDRDEGLLLNYANGSIVEGNAVRHSHKCVFIYDANKNAVRRNWFEDCEIGVHFTAGSERNTITENAFVNNAMQVMYVGTRFVEWSANGRGNYWSDNAGFDLDGDGISDVAYRPNNIMDQIIWRYPAAKLLLNSPATQVVRWAESAFPAIHPGGVVDSAPLMRPPEVPGVARLEESANE